jgi:hypothetical protein
MLSAFEEEPDSLLTLVNPVIQQTCGSHVSRFVAERMDFAHVPRKYCVILAELSYHIERLDIFRMLSTTR